MATTKSNDAWISILNDYPVIKEIDKNGYFYITSETINKYREARLMAKWDTYESLPEVFKKEKINILPVSRSAYKLGRFELYEELPVFESKSSDIQTIEVPHFETIDIDNISSESNAINVLLISNILSDFLNESNPVETFNGRMGTGKFEFDVDAKGNLPHIRLSVDGAQVEIDAGIETRDSVSIIEAKNVINNNMNIRQLYYPYRLWRNRVQKPLRNIFSVYSNKVYKILEYEFDDPENFSSIKLIKEASYSLESTRINLDEIINVHKRTIPIYDEDKDKYGVPTLQANSVTKLISLMEILSDGSRSKDEIAELMEFDIRQADYYFNAGRYLKIMDYEKIDNEKLRCLTSTGKDVLNGTYKHRQLEMVRLIFEHKLFHELFKISSPTGDLETQIIIDTMTKYNSRENITTKIRRASTIKNWVKWIYSLAS